MYNSEIRVLSLFTPTLDTRESASKLAHAIQELFRNNSKVTIDMNGIEFMSRSFADQLHKDLMMGETLDIEFKNADTGIIQMLNVVSNTQSSRKPIKKTHKIFSFNEMSVLRDYSFAW